jgi:hypothetical protein
MKTIIIMTTLLLIGGGILLFHFSNSMLTTVEVSILRDITDRQLSQPNVKEIVPLYNLSATNKWNGGIFRFQNVSDVSFNQTKVAVIETANQLFSNEFTREKQIERFTDSISHIVTDAAKDNLGKEYSSIYFPLASELNRLSVSKSQKRILIVYSDLMQNDLSVSLYAKELELLKHNPDSLKAELKKQKPLASLTGIEVYFIYQPQDAEQDQEFRIVSQFYTRLLEEKGATVTVAANLSN